MNRRTLPWILAACTILGPLAPPCQADSVDDFQGWFGLNTVFWEKGKWNLTFWTEARVLNDFAINQGYFVGPRTRYKAHKNLNLEFAVRYIRLQSEPASRRYAPRLSSSTRRVSCSISACCFWKTSL